MSTGARSLGILIVGHGTRDALGTRQFFELAHCVTAAVPETPVEPALLEMGCPTIAEGFDRLVAAGAGRIVAVPLMLFAAAHVRRDIPAAVASAAARHAGVAVRHAAHLGCRRSIVELSARRCDEALGPLPSVPPRQTSLVLAGRGSRDPRATEEMRRFAELRRARERETAVLVGFLAMARPPLSEVLQSAAGPDVRRVVVQPHLLFHGALVAQTEREVARARESRPQVDWVVPAPLGPSPLVVEAVLEAAGLACGRGGCEESTGARQPAAQPVLASLRAGETHAADRQLSEERVASSRARTAH